MAVKTRTLLSDFLELRFLMLTASFLSVRIHRRKQTVGGVNVTLSRWDIPREVTETTLLHLTATRTKAHSSAAELSFSTQT